ncbi:MAG: sulfatase [Opitutus sp.]|nr:sulfatase [Opitutus sp.]MCS6246636.1 sulfatase [Opitutus sp.]MCS6273102.1 sulfatase [Opitutus sp.]MCS6278894.1 sulfatase [Opitutus sp.]MCS6298644.1 sulfatase [Opitutus sp.]
MNQIKRLAVALPTSFPLLGLLLAGLFVPLRAADRPPNIIFVLADDLGWTDLACYGSKYYETPNLDRLAAQGMRLTNYHVSQNCAPTRGALLSGQYSARTGMYTVGSTDRFDWSKRPLRPVDNVVNLPLDRDTFADQLKKAGYATGMFGKWHIGEGGPLHPAKRGFDEALVTMGLHYKFKVNPPTEYPADIYLADWLTDRAVDFIARNKDRPFLLYLPHFGVHTPLQAKADLTAKFKGKPGVGGHNSPTFAAMIASVDESVGRVMAKLEELKLAENTVVIFSSDNGGVGGYDRPDGLIREPGYEAKVKKAKAADEEESGGGITDNTPLRSGKGSLYEGGVRVPFIVRWPGKVAAGAALGTPTAHVDLFPTLLELAGAAKPRQVLDGESLLPLLIGKSSALKRDAIFQHFPGYLGSGPGLWRSLPVSLVQMGDWKLMEFLEDGHLELYNLKDDLGETKNLAATNPEKAKELHERLIAWRKSTNAPMPTSSKADAATNKAAPTAPKVHAKDRGAM